MIYIFVIFLTEMLFKVMKQQHQKLTFGNEKIQHSKSHGVTAEHVIAASPHALYRHASPSPNHIRHCDFVVQFAISSAMGLNKISINF